MSAAVIGRQLRQQQNTNRNPGPVVPPTQYRGVDAEKKFAKFSQHYNNNSHEFYPHPAHRNNTFNNNANNHSSNSSGRNSRNDKRKLDKKNHRKKKDGCGDDDDDDNGLGKTKRLIFTRHCFCVAFKALSTGFVLLIMGTVMSIVGFFADSLAMEQAELNNGTYVSTINKGTKLHLHNLTYVGPVIMGLGGIVIIAACILTFEVRDTLGIHDDPKKRKASIDRKSKISEIEKGLAKNLNFTNGSLKKSAVKPSIKSILGKSSIGTKVIASISEQKFCKQANTSQQTESSTEEGDHQNETSILVKTSNESKNLDPNGNTNGMSTISMDSSLGEIPSSTGLELNDLENYSLQWIQTKPWKSRCSCSGSPTNSMHKYMKEMDSLVQHQKQSIDSNQQNQEKTNDQKKRHSRTHTAPMVVSIPNEWIQSKRQSNGTRLASCDEISLNSFKESRPCSS
ncbi:hypothetical protein SSS_05561 [Sarcoptes scabiei]|uniref:Uncharacterized protein n=1 Tax=Sarcoptes scabiei TaxID=52283 RepID=A0A834VAL0_SARSC|nr:hypothetical protein SSS_05561 [Sarcoptes scabiei]